MKVIFIFCNGSDDALNFPLGVGLLSAVLKDRGHKVKSIFVDFSDGQTVNYDNIADQVREYGPDVLAYSATSPAFSYIKKVAAHLGKLFDIPSICGGIHPTLYPDNALSAKGIDYICVGEGERPMIEFVEAAHSPDCIPDIQGIWKLGPDGSIIKNGIMPLEKELDQLPPFDYDTFGEGFISKVTEGGWLRFIMSRGCPYNCSYCHNKLIRNTYAENIGVSEARLGYVRFKGIQPVINEIKAMVEKYDIKVVNFMDDLFCLKKRHTREFCKAFQKQVPEQTGYSIQTHLAHLDENLVDALYESRCRRVVVGVESANLRILDLFKRKWNSHLMETNLQLLLKRKFPLGVWTLNILGNPTETCAEMMDTLSFNARNLVNVCKFNYMAPYPGSEIYDFCKENNLFNPNYGSQKFEDRYSSVLLHEDAEHAFLEKFFQVGHWYMNSLAPLGLTERYEPLIKEVEEIPLGQWKNYKAQYLKRDLEISNQLEKEDKQHYRFLYQGKIIGKVIGLTGANPLENTVREEER